MASSRRLVRIKVMQVLYAYEISKDPIEKVKKDLLTELDDIEKYNFAFELTDNVVRNVNMLDEYIKAKVANWEFDRIALIDKILLRMSISELLFFPEIPPKVSINEAIDIAKEYSTAKSGQFVNGILDSLLNDFIKENKIKKQGRGLLDIKKQNNPSKPGKNEK